MTDEDLGAQGFDKTVGFVPSISQRSSIRTVGFLVAAPWNDDGVIG